MLSNRRRSRVVTAALAMVLVGTGMPAASAEIAAGPPTPDGGRSRTTHLITGDTVVVSGMNAVITPAPGRERVSAEIRTYDGRISVIPRDARPLIDSGRIDPRLFDVTGLIEAGYTDDRDLGLIVTDGGSPSARGADGVRTARELPLVDGAALRAPVNALSGLWRRVLDSRSDEGRIWLDGIRRPSLDRSVAQIGAPSVWQAGFDGKGVKVAVLDTGIDRNHPDVAGQIVARHNFAGGDDRDVVGHGTHVASTIAGTGAASNGRYRGVAPGASLLDGRVCESMGCAESAILAGMNWAGEQGARIINLSLGSPDTPGTDPLEQAVNTLTEKYGTLVVAAAGNDGPEAATLSSPASASTALAVGAVDKSDELASFSSRGPSAESGAFKPEITAPGVDITAARSRDTADGAPAADYQAMSGTSMATPHVVGAAALLAQRDPKATPADLKNRLISSAVPNKSLSPHQQGFGRVDVAKALTQTVLSGPGIEFGTHQWPHTDDVAVRRPLTYRNAGSAPVTLALEHSASGPDGAPSPAGMFELSARTVTVPAGGTASVDLIADTRVAGRDGVHSGRVTATADDMRINTPFAVHRETESYDLTLVGLNLDGGETPTYLHLVGLEGQTDRSFVASQKTTIRVAKGDYSLVAMPAADDVLAFMTASRLRIDRDQTLTADSRQARPVSIQTSDERARALSSSVRAMIDRDGRSDVGIGAFTASEPLPRVGSLGTPSTHPKYHAALSTVMVDDLQAPTRFQHLAWGFPGAIPNGFDRTVSDAELATIQYERTGHGAETDFSLSGWLPGPDFTVNTSAPVGLRWERQVNEDEHIRWSGLHTQVAEGRVLGTLSSQSERYQAGGRYTERWNNAVFGPWWTGEDTPMAHIGDRFVVIPQLFGDGSGHTGSHGGRGRTVIHRDDALIADVPNSFAVVKVAPGSGRYRVAVEAEREPEMILSPRVNASWSFDLDQGTPFKARVPQVWSVRLQPELSPENTAPAGARMTMPAYTSLPGAAAHAEVDRLTVDYSTDDGRTWRPAEVHYEDGDWWVEFSNPDSGFVSLRSNLTDSSGNTAEQTIIRAYQIA